MKKFAITSLLFLLVLSSCQKVIDLKLKTSEMKYVLRGSVLAGDSVHTLSITTSVPFDQLNDFPAVTNATVVLSDNFGNTANMVYNPTYQLYVVSNFPAYEGRTYKMSVQFDDQFFESTCTMPYLVPLLNVDVKPTVFFGEESNILTPKFQDPAQFVNYYKFRYFERDSLQNDSGIILANDELSNGQLNQRPYFGFFDPQSGDTMIYQMWSIDASAYKYLFSKETNTSSLSGAPANPISNWSNDALGYLSVHTFQEIQFVIP